MSTEPTTYRTHGSAMTAGQERRLREAMAELVSAMNDVPCLLRLDHDTHKSERAGDPWPRYENSLTIDVIHARRIEVC